MKNIKSFFHSLLSVVLTVLLLFDILLSAVPAQAASEDTVSMEKPVFTCIKSGYGELCITWKKVRKAGMYRVYRREETKKSYKKLADTESLDYTDKTVIPGNVYYYRVKAYAKTADGYLPSKRSGYISGYTNYPSAVQISTVLCKEKYSKVSWSPSAGADGYQVFRSKTGKTGSYKKIATTKKTDYTDKKAIRKSTYYYKIRAYRKADGKTYFTRYSAKRKGSLLVHKICPDCGRIIVNPSESKWNLIVVNSGREIPKGYTPELKEILGCGKYLDYRVAPYYEKMYYAAKKDGITLTPYSAYRSYEHQKTNYNNLTDQYMRQYGLSRKEAAKKAATVILPPGTSEHNLGLAVDIGNTKSSFANSCEYAWLQKHAHEYGFILRYTKEKQSVTGIISEPWHWRYVGIEYAEKMKDSGLCLEEYLDSVGISY